MEIVSTSISKLGSGDTFTFRNGTLRYQDVNMIIAHRLLIFNTVYLHEFSSLLETQNGPGTLYVNGESGEGLYLTESQEFHHRK